MGRMADRKEWLLDEQGDYRLVEFIVESRQRRHYMNIQPGDCIGYFGKLEDKFVGWFYSEYGRSMTDQEYKQFWKKCRELVRAIHKKFDVFYFQE